jgi:N-methylhydantoinase A
MRETVLGALPVRSRGSIGESPVEGPLLIDEYDTTVVVRPGWSARRDPATDTLVLEALS